MISLFWVNSMEPLKAHRSQPGTSRPCQAIRLLLLHGNNFRRDKSLVYKLEKGSFNGVLTKLAHFVEAQNIHRVTNIYRNAAAYKLRARSLSW